MRDLYTFVCRNYEIGDQIYAFGFSRGAFTVRLLMGLIGRCGIVQAKAHTEAKLLEAVQMAYEAFRRDFLLRASKQRGMIYHFFLSPPPYMTDENGNETPFIQLPEAETIQTFIDIAFLGVWDTVDAYGMPVDELKLAIDRWVWPMSFADRDLSPRICKARHALSLDDERPTFRPVLWNEFAKNKDDPKKAIPLSADRIQQVWFSGVHSNVGGGYADDGLAYVTLDWMMNEAASSGLRFAPVARTKARWRANPHGEQYDSRSGIAGYYRYGPRKVKELCEDTEHGVKVVRVNVHPAVFERIERHQVEYAPGQPRPSVRVSWAAKFWAAEGRAGSQGLGGGMGRRLVAASCVFRDRRPDALRWAVCPAPRLVRGGPFAASGRGPSSQRLVLRDGAVEPAARGQGRGRATPGQGRGARSAPRLG